jgi:YesN/AraC family two-component response regulator
MVAEAFLPPVDGLTYVNHLDGNKENNTLSNLEWSSHEENMAHAGKANLMRFGQRHGGAKLSDADIATIREQYASGISPTELAKRFAVSVSYMGQVARGLRRVK